MPLPLHDSIPYDVRERIEMGEIDLKFVRTLSMAADQLTKHVGVKVLEIGKGLMGMTSG